MMWPPLLLGAWPMLRAWRNGQIGNPTLWLEVQPLQIALSAGVVASFIMACVAWGLFVSWRVHKVATAVAWAVGGVFFLFGVLPFLVAVTMQTNEEWLLVWHPLFVLNDLIHQSSSTDYASAIENSISCCVLWLVATALLLWFLFHALQRALHPLHKRAASTRAS